MYTDFFQLKASPLDELQGVYDVKLIVLSFLVATMASYIALDFTARLRDHSNTKKDTRLWLIGGSIAMGAGIWSMHFIGMLSFTIPGLVLHYSVFWTVFSLIVAICAAAFALSLLKKSIINLIHFIGGGLVLGIGIAAMHYTGMTAMLVSLNISYLPLLFLLSVLVAILASEAAIWFALKSNTVVARLRNRVKILSALTMGMAICGMHYIGMGASVFTPLCIPSIIALQGKDLDPTILAVIVAVVTVAILGIAIFASTYKEAKNQQQFEKARELGMAEISSSVLHNVGNVLNSVNISVETLLTNCSTTSLKNLKKLADLITSHKDDLSEFLTKDPRGTHVVAYLDELATHWEKEHQLEMSELAAISKHVDLIKNIISTQQNIIKVNDFEELVSINELLDETLLLSGIHLKKAIQVKKNYADLKPFLVDKIKLFQIVGNIFANAKEALLSSANPNKTLTVTTSISKRNKIKVQIADTGIGIDKINLDKIFIFGFTTKKSGHGFGLHASALAVNELGGEIRVQSKGENKGTIFTLYLPNRVANLLRNKKG